MLEILEVNDEMRINTRNKLKEAFESSLVINKDISTYPSEVHNAKFVPFEGSIHEEAGTGMSSIEIDDMYKASIPSLFQTIEHSLIAFVYRIAK